ncbi:DNA-binding protein [Saccharibacillus sp. O23]|uniref:DNA-binding protein n=1 Tax=Saccharibacillus sp. O23 TaxID=2009338 RepID=UPI000B4E7605|nr:DNA-binding protein [Saccharibacillus sp. O23]OWR31918.1 DNA-binding protein [Saccharibacillus sp. O23]
MVSTNVLRLKIKEEILRSNNNFAEFSRRSGVNRGVFSLILNPSSPKPISLNQLETIGKALNKESGWLFELYVEECFFNGKPNRRRVEPFLIRCAELGKPDCINQVLIRLKEDSKYVDMVFDVAEKLYLDGKIMQSVCFYEFVVHNVENIRSETLSISHYRLFTASISQEQEKNLSAMIRFEPHCDTLPIHYQLAALMKLIDLYFSFNEYTQTERCAKKLFLLSDEVYYHILQQRRQGKKANLPPLEKPLVVYYGYSLLAMSNLMLTYRKFAEGYGYLAIYEDLSWFEEMDEEAKIQVDRFSSFAQMNRNNFELIQGNEMAVEECINIIEEHPGETLVILMNLLEASKLHGFVVAPYADAFFKRLEDRSLDAVISHNEWIRNRFYLDFFYEQSLYYIRNNNYNKAIEAVKRAVQIADEVNSLDNRKVYQLLYDLMDRQLTLTSPDK